LRFVSFLVIRLQIRSISALSSGLCFPPFVATKSASRAAGKLCHRRNAAKIVSRCLIDDARAPHCVLFHSGHTLADPFNLRVIERSMLPSVCSNRVCFPCCGKALPSP